jgi:hypothetical protein
MSNNFFDYSLLQNNTQNFVPGYIEPFTDTPSDIVDISSKGLSARSLSPDSKLIKHETSTLIKKLPLPTKVVIAIKDAKTQQITPETGISKPITSKPFKKYVKAFNIMEKELEPTLMNNFGIVFNKTLKLPNDAKLFDVSLLQTDSIIPTGTLINNLAIEAQRMINESVVKDINKYYNIIRTKLSTINLADKNKIDDMINRYADSISMNLGMILFIIFNAMKKAISHLPQKSNEIIAQQIDDAIDQIIKNLLLTLTIPNTIDPIKAKLAMTLSDIIKRYTVKKPIIKKTVKTVLAKHGIDKSTATKVGSKIADIKKETEEILVKQGMKQKAAHVLATQHAVKQVIQTIPSTPEQSKIIKQELIKEIKSVVAPSIVSKKVEIKETIESILKKYNIDEATAHSLCAKIAEAKKEAEISLSHQGIPPKVIQTIATQQAVKQVIPATTETTKAIQKEVIKETEKIIEKPSLSTKQSSVLPIKKVDVQKVVQGVLDKHGIDKPIAVAIGAKIAEVKKETEKTLIEQGMPIKTAQVTATQHAITKVIPATSDKTKDIQTKIGEKITKIETGIKQIIPLVKKVEIKKAVQTVLDKHGIDEQTAVAIGTKIADVKKGTEKILVEQGVVPSAARVIATQQAVKQVIPATTERTKTIQKAVIKEVGKTITAAIKDDKLKTTIKTALEEKGASKQSAAIIADKIADTKKTIKSILVSKGVDPKDASKGAIISALDLKPQITQALVVSGHDISSASKIASPIATGTKKLLISEIRKMEQESPKQSLSPSPSYLLIPPTQTSYLPPITRKSIDIIRTIKPEELAQKLASTKFEGIDVDFEQRKMIYIVIISAIQTMISQILAIHEPLHMSYTKYLDKLITIISNEHKLINLAQKIISNKNFNDLLQVEHFGEGSYDGIMNIIQENLFDTQEDFIVDTSSPCMTIIIILIISIAAYLAYKYYLSTKA